MANRGELDILNDSWEALGIVHSLELWMSYTQLLLMICDVLGGIATLCNVF